MKNAAVDQTVVLASGNAGKRREFDALLAPLGWRLLSQAELGIEEADEPHATFVENALAKARHASACAGLPALADDSGLCVAALAGAPGVRSARYADDGTTPAVTRGRADVDARNNAKLIAALQASGTPPEAWAAEFVCVLVYLRHADDPLPCIAQGRWLGRIVAQPSGHEGFGYDPHFFVVEKGCTAAELGRETKNAISHRAQAMRTLVGMLSDSESIGPTPARQQAPAR